MTDITNLKGEELYKALLSGKPITVKANATSPADVVVLRPFENWRKEALFLIHDITTCQCGEQWETPNRYLLIKETHSKKGTQYRQITDQEETLRTKLPLIVEQHYYTAQACCQCLDFDKATLTEVHHDV